jgi:hypothetical protein
MHTRTCRTCVCVCVCVCVRPEVLTQQEGITEETDVYRYVCICASLSCHVRTHIHARVLLYVYRSEHPARGYNGGDWFIQVCLLTLCIWTNTRIRIHTQTRTHTYAHMHTHTHSIGVLALLFLHSKHPSQRQIDQTASRVTPEYHKEMSGLLSTNSKSANDTFLDLVGACLQKDAASRPSVQHVIALLDDLKVRLKEEKSAYSRCFVM